jgi:hypothetical protein
MLSALSGGDSLQIIVEMQNLTSAGFKQIQSDIAKTETAAGSVNLSNVDKNVKNVGKDATEAEGSAGGGGIMGMISGLTGLGPQGLAVGAAVAGMAALVAAAVGLGKTYDSIEQQLNLLDTALKHNGDSLAKEQTNLNDLITANEQYGQNADATRAAVTTLAQAGHSWSDIMQSMPTILDLAAAKHISLADAAKAVELAEMGNNKALKQLGIILPPVTASTSEITAAQKKVTTATNDLTDAQKALTLKEDELAGKHKLTKVQADELKAAQDKVTEASLNLHGAENMLSTAQTSAAAAGSRQTQVLNALNPKIGGSRNSATALQKAQAELNDEWQKAAEEWGPALESLFSNLVTLFAKMVDEAIDAINWVGGLWNQFADLAPVQAATAALGALTNQLADFLGLEAQGGTGNVVGGAFGKRTATPTAGGPGKMASGGYVPARSGGTLALLAEAGVGEYVVPENRVSTGGGTHFHVHFHTMLTPTAQQARQLCDVVESELGRRFALHGSSAAFGGF